MKRANCKYDEETKRWIQLDNPLSFNFKNIQKEEKPDINESSLLNFEDMESEIPNSISIIKFEKLVFNVDKLSDDLNAYAVEEENKRGTTVMFCQRVLPEVADLFFEMKKIIILIV